MHTSFNSDKSFHYKRQVAQRFDRAASTYDSYAEFQRVVLERLTPLIPCRSVESVLDLGTGTGQALSYLSSLQPTLSVGLDLSMQMLEKARQTSSSTTAFICADAESLPFADQVFELTFSSLAMQWCLNAQALFSELFRVTKPGGFLVFSTLCKGSMPEIEKAWQGIDDAPHINQYRDLAELDDYLVGSRWKIVSSQLATVPMWFKSPEDAIDSLKKVGASLVVAGQNKAMPISKWKTFIRQYEQQRESAGVPLRYQVAFVVVQKPMS